ncbi:TPA_asm: hypothetical protein G0E04_15995 [Salmonella enterica subsp. enterica serovar Napoli]|uniref:Uncharacterized protein n=1 Tax=Salmonella enterica subsp. enterica serovar Napoli TaxID=1151001 RepID=A0A702VYM5_SALET|nr:hypothetical protein [Salmonella enterica subsp. enterica serovar Napoli]EBR8618749.1 hypothetical protein [Salmonella enterica subsp. enterica serovar Napoli]EBU7217932.1 hypothetical protein [Salmonella enterica subsp. enterica serovar Napoli]EBU8162139.1 hypothetical protein [Salmonella enterica subsp. enterica serovar Napoli]EBU8231507.1 hypothetical protein [Salmonella enterica subsp. enterica serovar Napoli]
MMAGQRAYLLMQRYLNDEACLCITEVKVTHNAVNNLYYEESAYLIRFTIKGAPAWKCSKSTDVLAAGSSAGVIMPPR